jgi:hypothetical protein
MGPSQLERRKNKNERDGGADPALMAASRVWLLPSSRLDLLFFLIILCLFLI